MLFNRALPIFLLLFCSALYVLIFSLARLLEDHDISPLSALTFQVTLSAILMAAFAFLKGKFPRFDQGRAKHHFGIAFSYIVIPNAVIFYAAREVPTGYLSIVTVISALLTYLFALALRMEKVIWERALGIGLGFVGTLLLVLERNEFGQAVPLGWGLIALILPLALAVSNIWRQLYWPPQGTATSLAAGMMISAVPLVWVLAFFTNSLVFPAETSVYLILSAVTLAYVLYVVLVFEIIRLSGAVFIGQINYLIAAFGIITGSVVFGESLSVKLLLALILVFSGLSFVSFGRRRLSSKKY